MSKKKLLFFALVFSVFALFSFTAMAGKTKANGTHSAGDQDAFTADGTNFNMVYVPGGLTFPTGLDDKGTAKVDKAYWIGETPVTYELWYKVKTWAEKNGYTFANKGKEGSMGTSGAAPTVAKNEPVTTINWRDAMIWCNAATDWYNSIHKSDQGYKLYTVVYYADSNYTKPIKAVDNSESVSTDEGSQDNPYINSSANGFRLLISNEWELAARYHGSNSTCGAKSCVKGSGYFWTPGNYASGASAAYTDEKATKAVAWFDAKKTNDVKKLAANTLGLYDMSGNVWSWCFDWYVDQDIKSGSARVIRGGSWDDNAYSMQVGIVFHHDPFYTYYYIGFRLSRTDL